MRLGPARHIKFFGYFLIALVTAAGYDSANAQQSSQIPRPELSIPGVSQKSSTRFPTVSSSAYADFSSAKARGTQFKDEVVSRTRSLQDISLFHQAAPSVVLILVKDALGSGSLLKDNIILTNLHVVGHNRENSKAVGGVFVPTALPFFPTNADFREGILGSVELAMGGETPTLRPPCVGAEGSGPTTRP